MERRGFSLLVAGIFVALSAVPTFAAAEGGLAVIAIISPPDRAINEAVDVDVQVFRWGALAEADTVVMRSYSGPEVTLTRVGVGRYHGSLTLDPQYFTFSYSITFYAEARVGNTSAYTTVSYVPRAPPLGSADGTGVLIRIMNLEQIGWFPAPGDTVRFEARTYAKGTTIDVPALSGSVEANFGGKGPYLNYTSFALDFVRQEPGVFTGSLAIDSGLTASAYYYISANFREGDPSGNYYFGYGSTALRVHPVPALAWLESVTASSSVLRVLAGDMNGPIAGAQVSASVESSPYMWPYPPPGPGPLAPVSTDANGSAELQTPYGKNVSAVTVSVASGGKSTNLRLVTGGSPYYGSPPNYSSYGFSARVVSDTASIHPGDTATIVVHLEVNGTPMYARRVTQIVYPSERPGAIVAGNVTTSPTGNFTVTYPIPSDWTPADSLNILVQAPEGEQLLNVQFGASQLRLSPRLPLTAAFDAANRRIALSANFTGSETLSGASLLVMLVPGADRYSFLSSVDGKPLFAALARTGSSFSGVLEVPSWMPLGNYTVFARLSNGGATTSAWDIVDAFNATVVQVKEAPPKTETKGVLPGFVPGFEAAFALGAIAAAAAWTGLATEHKIDRRSRRKARNP